MLKSLLNPSLRSFSNHIRYIDPKNVSWYPGHINKSVNKINRILKKVDIIVEIHDSRLMFSGRPKLFKDLDLIRPRLLVFSKIDLAEKFSPDQVKEQLEEDPENAVDPNNVIFTQLNQRENIVPVIKSLFKMIKSTVLEQDFLGDIATISDMDSPLPTEKPITCLVVGLPNCGKSTFITALRSLTHGRNKVARVGRNAGQTTAISQPIIISRDNMKIGNLSLDRNIQMIDTPGILEPQAGSIVTQLSLAGLGMLKQDNLDKKLILDYLLFLWNHKGFKGYVDYLGLDSFTEDVEDLIKRTAQINNFTYSIESNLSHNRSTFETIEEYEAFKSSSKSLIDLEKTCVYILTAFSRGKMGRFSITPEDELAASDYFRIND